MEQGSYRQIHAYTSFKDTNWWNWINKQKEKPLILKGFFVGVNQW